MRANYRASMRTKFSRRLWDRWLNRLNGVHEPSVMHLAAGIDHFRKACALKEPQS